MSDDSADSVDSFDSPDETVDSVDSPDETETQAGGGNADQAIAVLTHVVKSVVGDPDAVVVNTDASGETVALTVEVGPGDMGRVIGRRGRIANAIRTVVRAAGVRDGVSIDVEFLD